MLRYPSCYTREVALSAPDPHVPVLALSTNMAHLQTTPSDSSYNEAQSTRELYPWYLSNIDKYLILATWRWLTEYAKIPGHEHSAHIHHCRDLAWNIRAFPYSGLGVFLVPFVSRSPVYPHILSTIQNGGRFMDIGCGLGMDLRQLVFDDCPSDRLTGVDIVSQWDVGYRLFCDKDTFQSKYVEADLLDLSTIGALQELKGEVDVIEVSGVMHQWEWIDQLAACKQIVAFSKVGTIVLGHQIGSAVAGNVDFYGAVMYRQSPESFERLWEEVGQSTKTSWKVDARLRSWQDIGWLDVSDIPGMDDGIAVLDFVVSRVA